MPAYELRGVIPAVPTPVSPQGNVDVGRLISFCGHLLAEGADGLNITGTTGEATSLSREQRLEIIFAVAGSALDKRKIMIGTGAAAVADAVTLSRAVGEHGFAGALVLPPFYFKDPSEAGLLRYFEAIVKSSPDLDIYLYNFPALSGIRFTIELIAALVHAFGSRIKGLKDSSGDLNYASGVVENFPQLSVFPSNEGTLLQAREGKFAGAISATANLSPAACAAAFRNGDSDALKRAVAIRAIVAKGSLVPRIKSVLSRSLSDDYWANVLPPYAPLGTDAAQELFESIQGDLGRF
ncbi:MAG TPA: dihydrodipicolinate synthase family protein [Bauldia sp.]|nr:dihydrodipicolinate synthase family protein [Bauldia sp.]